MASLLADVGHEIPTTLLASLVTGTLGAPATAFGVIEGISDGLAGTARFVGDPLADDPWHRQRIAVGVYTTTAVLSSLIGIAHNAVTVGLLRGAAWAARGLRVPPATPSSPTSSRPRPTGFERAIDNLGAILGPCSPLALVAVFSVRTAVRHATRQRHPLRIHIRPVLHGQMKMLVSGAAEAGGATGYVGAPR